MKEILGHYTIKSPYHKNKRILFEIVSVMPGLDYPVQVITTEYKGKKGNRIKTAYTFESIKTMIDNKVLRRKE